MATFQYIAKDASGNETRGTVEAGDRSSAIAAVRAQGLMPTALGEVKSAAPAPAAAPARGKAAKKPAAKKGGGLNKNIEIKIKLPKFLQGRIKTKVLTQFTRQLATLVNAGLALMRGLEVLKRQMKNQQMREALEGISDNIAAGGTFSEALTAYPKIFDNLYINMVKAGEAGGVLEVVLARLADFAEKSEKIKNKVKGAMIYPSVVLFAAIGITAFLLVMVIPKFKQVFSDMLGGQSLPAVTEFVIQASEFVQHNGLMIFIAAVALFVIVKVIGKTEAGAYFFDALKLKLPVFGQLNQKVAVARFARIFSQMVHSGVPILDGLSIVAKACGNKVIGQSIMDARSKVEQGDQISNGLDGRPGIPLLLTRMVAAGEKSGKLDEMLDSIADTYEDEVEAMLASLTSLMEPMLMGFMGVLIGGIVIAMYLPIFKMSSIIN